MGYDIFAGAVTPYTTPGVLWATGNSPLPAYEVLRHRTLNDARPALTAAYGYNMDSFGLGDRDPYHAVMDNNVYNPLGERVKFLCREFPTADNYRNYDRMIARNGGICVGIIGIGPNAHVGLAEPGADPNGLTDRFVLTQEARQHNAFLFGDDWRNVPETAYSVGIRTVCQIPTLIMFAFGRDKVRPVLAAFNNKPDRNVPASHLGNLPGLHLIVDEELFFGLVAANKN